LPRVPPARMRSRSRMMDVARETIMRSPRLAGV
jgi:hypothetical protein